MNKISEFFFTSFCAGTCFFLCYIIYIAVTDKKYTTEETYKFLAEQKYIDYKALVMFENRILKEEGLD